MIFNSRERKGVLVMLVLIACTIVIPRQLLPRDHPFFLLQEMPEVETVPQDTVTGQMSGYSKPMPPPTELNTADSAALIKVRGIGPYYARKIIRYRERLGGFHSVRQLKELNMTYFNIDSCQGAFSVNPALIQKRDLDTMSFKAILRHPYLEYEDVQLIMRAKQKYGELSYRLLEEKGILAPYKLKKIKPYFR